MEFLERFLAFVIAFLGYGVAGVGALSIQNVWFAIAWFLLFAIPASAWLLRVLDE